MASREFLGKSVQQLNLPSSEQSRSSSSTSRTERRPDVRSLKIETDGDFAKGQIKPKIRLIGRWLERAGFQPGTRVQVKCVARGIIELRSTGEGSPNRPEM